MDINPKADEWNELWTLFGAYLNQDSPEEYGSPEETVKAFCHDATPGRVERAADQVRRILNGTEDDESVLEAVRAFGLEYHPELDGWTLREWLAELESVLRDPGRMTRL